MEGLAKELAEERGLEFVGRVDPFPNVFEFKLSHKVMLDHSVERGINIQDEQSIEDALHNELSGHPSVKWVSKQVALKRTKREFSDPAFNQQWHLVNRLERGHDTNVSGVWKEGVNGAGVTVAVVDDGVERLNPDLSSNYDAHGSYDYNDKDSDPSPNLKAKYDNSHGTK
jgi:subtilisin family serine protease